MCGLGGGASGSASGENSPERGVNMIQLKIRSHHPYNHIIPEDNPHEQAKRLQ